MKRARDRRRAKAKRRDVLMKQASMERRIRIATNQLLQHGPVKVLMRDGTPLDPPEIVEPELFVMIRRPNGARNQNPSQQEHNMKKLIALVVFAGLAASAQAGPLFKTAKFAVHAVKATGHAAYKAIKHL